MDFLFFLNSVLLGIGLAIDAFSVSIANGLNEPKMNFVRTAAIASVYAAFQFGMPLIGWICVHTIVAIFSIFQKFIPYIALILLLYIGGTMIFDAIKETHEQKHEPYVLSFGMLLMQGIATSIDALSVGFAIAEYDFLAAFIASLIIAIVTFFICVCGLKIGKKIGSIFSTRAQIFGGVILVAIGIEIFLRGIL